MEQLGTLQSLIRDYKQALADYEIAEKKKSYLREEFLKVVDYTPGIYSDLTVAKSKDTSIVEWQRLADEINISQDLINKYIIHRPGSLRVTVRRTINND